MIKEKHTKWDYALENRMYIHNGVEDNKEDFLAILDCQKICYTVLQNKENKIHSIQHHIVI